mmetsp:Transcript_65717/g.182955  ORF Transcript_65717/g.182955 Transcript_65717/m.182955 type:complete len:417 (-) Transcript_65717:80-1330(-)
MGVDAVAITYALLGGLFMGSYPVPIKARSVLEVGAHPLIFQCYKSFWVFVTGCVFLLWRAVEGKDIVFEFSWWAVASAAAWIPGGMCTIAAVPLIGVGLTVVVCAGTASGLSFFVFWLVLGEKMKEHGATGHTYFMAPVYFVCVCAGMVGLVSAQHLGRSKPHRKDIDMEEMDRPGTRCAAHDDELCPQTSGDKRRRDPDLATLVGQPQGSAGIEVRPRSPARRYDATPPECSRPSRVGADITMGLGLAVCTGVSSAVQFGIVNVGKRLAQDGEGCRATPSTCSPLLEERFNNFGSWMTSFGIGAALVTCAMMGAVGIMARLQGTPMPPSHFMALRVPGSIAGFCWSLGAVLQTASVVKGGSAVMMPATQAVQLITSGAWGVLHYHEVRGLHAVAWVGAAAWTAVSIVLLSGEKAS